MKAGCWIEAMRLRTLPVSLAGVAAAVAYGLRCEGFRWVPAVLCVVFATLAQISSNFANEYFDYRNGLDRKGREGPRRGVTEGDITPRAMLVATLATLALACAAGCWLIAWGGWWLLGAGVVIAIGVMAYSAGPYPLSHHGLGEVAVVFFFGIIPVNLTYYVTTGAFDPAVAPASVAIGLMGANVLIVNNYRDADDDRAVGKRTLAVALGRRAVAGLYLADGVAAALLLVLSLDFSGGALALGGVYVCLHVALWSRLRRWTGVRLNPLLGMTACLMLVVAAGLFIVIDG